MTKLSNYHEKGLTQYMYIVYTVGTWNKNEEREGHGAGRLLDGGHGHLAKQQQGPGQESQGN